MSTSTQSLLLADTVRPVSREARIAFDAALIVGGSLLIAVGAQVALPLPGSPVPVTLQTFAVLLLALLLGPRRSTAAVALYLAEGLAGMPVFTPGATLGFARLAGPTGGYLLGFLPAAWLVGTLAQRGLDRRVPTALLTMALGMAVILASGVAWLAWFAGFEYAIQAGLIPFLPGEAAKIAVAGLLLPGLWKMRG